MTKDLCCPLHGIFGNDDRASPEQVNAHEAELKVRQDARVLPLRRRRPASSAAGPLPEASRPWMAGAGVRLLRQAIGEPGADMCVHYRIARAGGMAKRGDDWFPALAGGGCRATTRAMPLGDVITLDFINIA
jgi:hypothetical protein